LEASVLSQPAGIATLGVRAPLRRFHGDERLIALIRAGDEAAFEALVQRYRSRLLAFCRHMLRSREDAEDVLQEVFASAYRAIKGDEREINVRPWLYRIARNMCLKHMARRRPLADGGVEDLDLPSASSTLETVSAREDLRHVVHDVQGLPETQRTALLMREIDGLSYDQIATAMDTTVPGVKSLLVRARVALAETAEGRLLTCDVVHLELSDAASGRVRLSGAARRHAKSCETCGVYQAQLGVGRRAAAFWPLAPLALVRELLARLGLGAGAGASAAGAGAAVSGGAAGGVCGACGTAVTTTLGAIGGKAAVVVATAGLVAAGAAHIDRTAQQAPPAPAPVVQSVQHAPASTSSANVTPTTTKPTPAEPSPGGQTPDATVVDDPTAAEPTNPADGGGTLANPQDPASGPPAITGGMGVPTDPASQPMDAPEPVEVVDPAAPGAQSQPAPTTNSSPASTPESAPPSSGQTSTPSTTP
jgi:RNA polymerase sigma factor (sigma-70 family)